MTIVSREGAGVIAKIGIRNIENPVEIKGTGVGVGVETRIVKRKSKYN